VLEVMWSEALNDLADMIAADTLTEDLEA
jgi:hypothetical protein